jgi:hypothetical protein
MRALAAVVRLPFISGVASKSSRTEVKFTV